MEKYNSATEGVDNNIDICIYDYLLESSYIIANELIPEIASVYCDRLEASGFPAGDFAINTEVKENIFWESVDIVCTKRSKLYDYSEIKSYIANLLAHNWNFDVDDPEIEPYVNAICIEYLNNLKELGISERWYEIHIGQEAKHAALIEAINKHKPNIPRM